MNNEWNRSTRYFVFALVLGITVWFVYAARALVGPLAVAALLAYVLNPVVTFVNEQARLRRTWVVIIVYLLSLTGLIFGGIVLLQYASEQTTNFISELQIIAAQIQQDYLSVTFNFLGTQIQLSSLLPESNGFLSGFVRPDLALELLQATTTNLGWVLVVLFTAYYLLKDWDKLRDWFFKWTPDAYEPDMRQLYYHVQLVWKRYLQGQLRLSIIMGLITGIISIGVGLPGAIMFGVLAAVFDVLLSVGPAIVIGVAGVVAFFLGSNTLPVNEGIFALIIMGAFGGVQVLENVWLRPRIMSSSLKIHPAIVFVGIVGSLALAGVLTALIIVPLMGTVGVVGRYIYCKLFKLDPWADFQPIVMTAPEPETADSAPPLTTASKSQVRSS